jgi:hypothetical protein
LDIITDSVKKLETILEHSGCEDVGVLLDVNPDAINCQFDRGACMNASFGGRSAEFVTNDPIRAQTKISFLIGAPLDTLRVRSAACAIVNVATGFFCLSRTLHACPGSSHTRCQKELEAAIQGKRILCVGTMPVIDASFRKYMVTNPEGAEVILVNGEGIIARETGDLIEEKRERTRIICLGPSTAGVARLQQIENWCPYGTGV